MAARPKPATKRRNPAAKRPAAGRAAGRESGAAPGRTVAPAGARAPSDSAVAMREIVLPNDANVLNTLLGGRLMHWMDLAAAMAAHRHARRPAVTASVDHLSFHHGARVGDHIIIRASVNRVFRTSMEVGVKVLAEDLRSGTMKHTSSAYFTFVTLDDGGKPVEGPPVTPETPDEKRRFRQAGERRERRLAFRS